MISIKSLQTLRRAGAPTMGDTTPPPAKSKPDADANWKQGFRTNAYLLSALCKDYKLPSLSVDQPPYEWEMASVRNAITTLPPSVQASIREIGSAPMSKLHEHATVLQDEGTITDDETIAALFAIASTLGDAVPAVPETVVAE